MNRQIFGPGPKEAYTAMKMIIWARALLTERLGGDEVSTEALINCSADLIEAEASIRGFDVAGRIEELMEADFSKPTICESCSKSDDFCYYVEAEEFPDIETASLPN